MPPEENAPVHIEDFVPSLLTEPKKDAAPAPRDAQPPARAAAEATPEIDESDDLSPDDLIDEPGQSERDDSADPVEDKPRYRLKYGDSEVEIDQDELEKRYGLSREFEEKQPHIASYEDAVATEYAALQKSRNQYDSMLAHMESRLSGPERTAEQWEALRRDDEIAYAKEYADYQRRQESKRVIASERERIANEQAAEQRKQVEEYVATERTKLLNYKEFASWKDEKKRAANLDALKAYAKTQEFTDSEIDTAYDSRMVRILEKARRYDALVEKKDAARKQVEAAPQMAEPGARNGRSMPPRVRDRLAATKELEKNGGKITDTVARGLLLQ